MNSKDMLETCVIARLVDGVVIACQPRLHTPGMSHIERKQAEIHFRNQLHVAVAEQSGSPTLKVSLRGSLAAKLVTHESMNSTKKAATYVRSLLTANDPDLLKTFDGEQLVIGRQSERGKYSPDW